MRDLDVGPDAFRAALHDLVEGGRISVSTTRDGRLIVGRERRAPNARPPGRAERRGAAALREAAGTSEPV